MPKWGNPVLQGIIDDMEKRRIKAVQDATRLAKRRPQGVAPERSFARLGNMLGSGAAFGGYAPTYDEMFLEAVRRQRMEADSATAATRSREERSNFYKGRKSAEQYRRALPVEFFK